MDDIRKKLAPSLLVSTFFGLTLFCFGPVNLYYSNILEYSSSFTALIPFLVFPLLLVRESLLEPFV